MRRSERCLLFTAIAAAGMMLTAFGIGVAQELHLIGSCPVGSPNGIFVAGNYAYIADGSLGLGILDIQDPFAPEWVTILETNGFYHKVVVKDTLALLANDTLGLQIINIADPEAPFNMGSVNLNYTRCLGFKENYAYVADMIGHNSVIDFSDPANPIIVNDIGTTFGNSRDIEIVDSTMYILADGSEPYQMGLYLFDISNPAVPSPLGQVTGTNPSEVNAVAISGDYAYIGTGTGLRIDYVADRENPEEVGTYHLPGVTMDIIARDSYLFVGTSQARLYVLDVSNPADISIIDTATTAGMAWGLYADERFVYVGADTAFQIFKFYEFTCDYIPGDANGNGHLNGLDVVYMVNWLKGAPYAPPDVCECPPHGNLYAAADVNGSCAFNGMDVTYWVEIIIPGGEPRFCPDCPPSGQ